MSCSFITNYSTFPGEDSTLLCQEIEPFIPGTKFSFCMMDSVLPAKSNLWSRFGMFLPVRRPGAINFSGNNSQVAINEHATEERKTRVGRSGPRVWLMSDIKQTR